MAKISVSRTDRSGNVTSSEVIIEMMRGATEALDQLGPVAENMIEVITLSKGSGNYVVIRLVVNIAPLNSPKYGMPNIRYEMEASWESLEHAYICWKIMGVFREIIRMWTLRVEHLNKALVQLHRNIHPDACIQCSTPMTRQGEGSWICLACSGMERRFPEYAELVVEP